MNTRDVPVLIVGRGLAGLTAAVTLAWRGVPVLLVERHAGTLRNPPSARPGTRAPHVAFLHRGARISSLDLPGRELVLLCGAGASGWVRAGMAIAWPAAAPLAIYRVGADLIDVERRWQSAFGVSDSGAVLLRPDGYIAWRSPGATDSSVDILTNVLARVLCRTPASLRQPAGWRSVRQEAAA